MEITRNIFWREAARSGTLLGLVLIGINLLKYAAGLAGSVAMAAIVNILYVVVFILLILVFTRRIAGMSDPGIGFSWGRCMGFVLATMLFVGFLLGIYTTIMNNFVYPDVLEQQIRNAAAQLSTNQFLGNMVASMGGEDAYAQMALRMMKNPLLLVFTQIITVLIQGGFAGLFTSMVAKRDPKIF